MSACERITCAACGAPYHEATGHRFTDTMVICGACARSFVQFIKFQTRRKNKGFSLADAAGTSIKPPKEEE